MPKVKHYNSTTSTNVPAASSLLQGELAMNIADKKLWVGDAAGDPVLLADFQNDGTGTDINLLYSEIHNITRTLGTTADDTVELGNYFVTNGAVSMIVSISCPSSGYAQSEMYTLGFGYNDTNNTWQIAKPCAGSGSYSGNEFQLLVNQNGQNTYLKLRRVSGATSGDMYISLMITGASGGTWTSTSGTGTESEPSTYYLGSYEQIDDTPIDGAIYNAVSSNWAYNLFRSALSEADYGSDLVTNGAFATDPSGDWTYSSPWTWDGTNLRMSIPEAVGGGVASVHILNRGTGYAVNDTITLTAFQGTGCTLNVDTIDAQGGVTAVSINAAGSSYVDYLNWSVSHTTDGSGTGFEFAIDATTDVASMTQSLSISTGKVYEITFDVPVRNYYLGTITVSLGGASVTFGQESFVGSSTKKVVLTTTSTAALSFTPTGSWGGTIDNVVVKEITNATDVVTQYLNDDDTNGIEIRSGGSGLNNVFIGIDAGERNISGYQNTAVGTSSLVFNATGYHNTALGYQTLLYNSSGYRNTSVGATSLRDNQDGYKNTAVGAGALTNNEDGFYNTAVGNQALELNTDAFGNCAFGDTTLRDNTRGWQNCAFGQGALYSNTYGQHNNAFGYAALALNTTGTRNLALGQYTMYYNKEGYRNVACGGYGLFYNINGRYNTSCGYVALEGNIDGDYNAGLGYNAGAFIANGTTSKQHGNNSTFLGTNSKASIDGLDNETVVGANAIGAGQNTVVLGDSNVTRTYVAGSDFNDQVLVRSDIDSVPVPKATNVITNSNNLTTSWTLTGTPITNFTQTGIDGSANSASYIEDDDAASVEYVYKTGSRTTTGIVTNTLKAWVKKDTTETRFPSFDAYATGGTSAGGGVNVNTKTGATGEPGYSTGTYDSQVIDAGDWWIVLFEYTTSGDETGWRVQITPARGTTITGNDNSAVGSIIVGNVEFYENLSMEDVKELDPLITTSTALTVDTTVPVSSNWAYNISNGVEGGKFLLSEETLQTDYVLYKKGDKPYYSDTRIKVYKDRVVTNIDVDSATGGDKYYEMAQMVHSSLEGEYEISFLFAGSGGGTNSRYNIPVTYNMDYFTDYGLEAHPTNTWVVATPSYQSPRHFLDQSTDVELQYNVNANTIKFRAVIRSPNGGTGAELTLYAKFTHSNDFDNVTYTELTGTGTDATSYTVVPSIQGAIDGYTLFGNKVKAKSFESSISTGTAPLVVASTTLVTNLNADQVDGNDASDIVLKTDVDDVPVDAATTVPISSNWAYDLLNSDQTIAGLWTSTARSSLADDASLTLSGGNSVLDTWVSAQISFSYGGTGTDYRHAIRTQHDAGGDAGNSIGFYLWDHGTDGQTDVGTFQALVLDQTGSSLNTDLDVTGNITVSGTVDGVDIANDVLVHGDVDDTPVDTATTVPISSNWAFDHINSSNLHIPAGGTTGQVLAKDTATDYDVSWQDQSGTGGVSENDAVQYAIIFGGM